VSFARTLGELNHRYAARTIKEEMRENLVRMLRCKRGAVSRNRRVRHDGHPGAGHAILSKHDFILLGLRARRRPGFCAASSVPR